MFIYDTILDNFDRHGGNWGIISYRHEGNTVRKMAPIFDNRASLLPRANFTVKLLDADADEKNWWKNRVYTFPNSKIMFRQRERSNYYIVYNSGIIPQKYKDGFEKFDIEDILNRTFEGNDFLNLEEENFYRKYIELRYKCIVRGEEFDTVYEILKDNSGFV